MKLLPQKHHTVAVLGVGRSGMAVINHLLSEGVRVIAYDRDLARRPMLDALGVPLLPLTPDTALGGDIVFRSPGIRPDIPPILRAVASGACLSDEISLFAALCPAPIIAVSGSDGKTTTATLIHRILSAGGYTAHLGGNIGQSLLPRLSLITPRDICVLELSSFQLMDAELSAAVGVITNLTPNHLNWHKDISEYADAKRRLCAMSKVRVLRSELFPATPAVRFSATEAADFCLSDGHLTAHGRPVLARDALRLLGLHNAENCLAALAATEGYLPLVDAVGTVARFRGVRHRMEWVCRRAGVDFVNSSIDTTPSRTAATLAALAEQGMRPLVLVGGADKGLALAPLSEALGAHAKAVYLFGAAAGRVARHFHTEGLSFRRYLHMEEAFNAAKEDATEGDTVLLSPAFTSFDAFADYEARGDAFARLARAVREN